MQEEAVLRATRVPSSRTLAIAPAVGYEEFRQRAWIASQEIGRKSNRHGVIPIRDLRSALSEVPAATFTQHLLRLERNGVVYLIAPEDSKSLNEVERASAVTHPAGDVRSFVMWIGPKPPRADYWD